MLLPKKNKQDRKGCLKRDKQPDLNFLHLEERLKEQRDMGRVTNTADFTSKKRQTITIS